jgi:predicted branched-subunit amino acid permease
MTRDIAAITAAVGLVGLSFGALAAAAGLSLWIAIALSALVLAGGSQFLFVAVLAAGASPWAGVLGGLLINARHLPFGLAISDVVGRGWLAKIIGAHLLIDEVVAYSRVQRSTRDARAAYWACGIALAVVWNVTTIAGALLGSTIPDPNAFGVDAAFPAALLALLLPGLRGASTDAANGRRVVLTGSACALLLTPWLPPGLPVIAGLAGLMAVRKEAA